MSITNVHNLAPGFAGRAFINMTKETKSIPDNMEWQQSQNLKRGLSASQETLNNKTKRTASPTSSPEPNESTYTPGRKAAHADEKTGYSIKAKGPFAVWVKPTTPSDNPLNIYSIGKIVCGNYKTVLEVKKDGRYKGIIIFQCRDEANFSLTDKKFTQRGLTTFIPDFKKTRKGVIKGIPIELSEDELKDALICEVDISKVTRLNRRNPAFAANGDEASASASGPDNNRWIPTTSILVSFDGDSLPREISLYHVKTKVSPYVKKTVQCLKCFRFGHIAKYCRGKPRCPSCGDEDHPNIACQVNTPRCLNCKGPHKSTYKECNVFKKHEAINIMMAHDNISYYEASQLVFGNKTGPASTKENFSSLKWSHTAQRPVINYSDILKDSAAVIDNTLSTPITPITNQNQKQITTAPKLVTTRSHSMLTNKQLEFPKQMPIPVQSSNTSTTDKLYNRLVINNSHSTKDKSNIKTYINPYANTSTANNKSKSTNKKIT